jgi:Transposase DDE domain
VFVRKVKVGKSMAFQVGHKQHGRFVLDKHIGSAPLDSPIQISALSVKAKNELLEIKNRYQLTLFNTTPKTTSAKLKNWRITGFHQVFGLVYDRIGFPNTLLRDLVIGRIVYPKSKLATIQYFAQYLGINHSKDSVYRFLDSIEKEPLVKTAYTFVSTHLQGITYVLYDVTTLHFETNIEDDLRQKGFSKIHRHDLPQVLIGLFVDINGYPFDFDVFSGSTFEGRTLKIVVSNFLDKHPNTPLTIVADAGMLSQDNLDLLVKLGVNYIVGARIKNLSSDQTTNLLTHNYSQNSIYSTVTPQGRLLVDYSFQRAEKNKRDRERQVQKVQRDINNHKPLLRKRKYLDFASDIKMAPHLNQKQVEKDAQFDGLKGYLTSLNEMLPDEVIGYYKNLWKVEAAFRMSKSDLKERPVFHSKEKRILAHLCICFVSLLVMIETERILKAKSCSLQKAIQLLGRVGSGIAEVGGIEVPIDSEIDLSTQSILNLFEGH